MKVNLLNLFKKKFWLGPLVVILLVLFWTFVINKIPKKIQDTKPIMTVIVKSSSSNNERITLRMSGFTKASKKIKLFSETSGEIHQLHAKKGSFVEAKDHVATIKLEHRSQQLKEAKALYELKKAQYDIKKKLSSENFVSHIELKNSHAEYEAAASKLSQIEKEISNTVISAPFKGVLGDIFLEEGSTVAPGKEVATLLDLNPILIEGYISEKNYGRFKVGEEASVTLLGNREYKGKVNFVSSIADPKTHMFMVEVIMDNIDLSIPEGITARVDIPTEQKVVHKIFPSSLSLNKKGETVVKTVEEGKVKSYSVSLVKSEGSQIWVEGLPPTATIINYGGDLVNDGEMVKWTETSKSEPEKKI